MGFLPWGGHNWEGRREKESRETTRKLEGSTPKVPRTHGAKEVWEQEERTSLNPNQRPCSNSSLSLLFHPLPHNSYPTLPGITSSAHPHILPCPSSPLTPTLYRVKRPPNTSPRAFLSQNVQLLPGGEQQGGSRAQTRARGRACEEFKYQISQCAVYYHHTL